ncbi:Hpt domain-containing protein [Telmatobacter bradus]|uniref:Hpt domain-containing protein n=1 Tax=Telmatobacter bradus TaxID=474953 RepID=UPI003B43A9E4
MNTATHPGFSSALNQLWIKFLPQIQERLESLETSAQACAQNRLSYRQCQQAHDAAHKLAGSLGTFGLTRGTVLAHDLEILFSAFDPPIADDAEQLAKLVAELRALIESHWAQAAAFPHLPSATHG